MLALYAIGGICLVWSGVAYITGLPVINATEENPAKTLLASGLVFLAIGSTVGLCQMVRWSFGG